MPAKEARAAQSIEIGVQVISLSGLCGGNQAKTIEPGFSRVSRQIYRNGYDPFASLVVLCDQSSFGRHRRRSNLRIPPIRLILVMPNEVISAGIVHVLPDDLRSSLAADRGALERWEDITALARNEWICWVEDAKLLETRHRRLDRALSDLKEGKRRPCCWPGCSHREKTGKGS